MSLRKVLAWLFVLAVAAGAYFYTARQAGEVTQKQLADSKVLSLADPLHVEALELSGDDYPKTVRIERRDAEHKWQMTQPVDWTADGVRVGRLLDTLLGAHWQRRLEERQQLAEFGLDPPRVRVRVWDRQGALVELLVGDESPSGEFFYAAPPDGKGEVWLLPGKDRLQISLTLFDLRDKAVLDFVVANVKAIRLESARTGQLRLERKTVEGEDQWFFHGGGAASAEDVRDWLFQIHGLRALDFVDSGINPAAMGLTKPVTRLTLSMKDGQNLGLEIGAQAKTGPESYVRRLLGGQVMVVKDKSLAVLNKARKDLAFRKVWDLARERVVALEVQGPGESKQAFAKQEGQWQRTLPPGKDEDGKAASFLIWDLSELKYEEILPAQGDYGLEPPQVKITVKERLKTEKDQVRSLSLFIGKKDEKSGLLPVRVAGDARVFGVKPELADSIPPGDDQKSPSGT
ncbi:hypothetical protein AAU61_08710 [Desulfocarbo indianensis]|nr:hypothetical protein AAU61_08710 [Desulfocarbo indianensis]